MDEFGTNPNPASASGSETMTLAESFQTLRADLIGAVGRCIDAAGEPEVTGGYEDFGEKWATDLNATAAHGESVGATTVLSVTDGVGTDAENADTVDIPAPKPSPAGISAN
ncbi:hypothetical protein [Glycomyces sp. NPDC048151]|uniref:hypothetical protein n=1 Tax=Glycomyces sp. NPDC048151 TaxID=3364002 RepID=UPI0037234155